MLSAPQALRLGMRAALRNPELSLGAALLDVGTNALALLPWALALVAVAASAGDSPERWLRLAVQLPSSLGGMAVAAGALSWALDVSFQAGALPLLAADAELGARPPPGLFAPLVARGVARVAAAAALGGALTAGLALACLLGFTASAVALLGAASPGRLALLAALAMFSAAGLWCGGLLARLALIRSAVLGEKLGEAFTRGANLLAARPFALALIGAVFWAAGAAVSASAAALAAGFSSSAPLSLTIAPRVALALAISVPLAFLRLGGSAAVAALVADAEGLVPPFVEPSRPGNRSSRAPEPVIDAIEAPEEIVDALPVDEDPDSQR